MRYEYQKELQKLNNLYESTGWLELTELEDSVHLYHSCIPKEEILLFLEENNFDYVIDEDDEIFIYDSFEELQEELDEYDLISDASASFIVEAVAKRKMVIRKGKRKIIFKCAPGLKKIGKRRCVKRPSRELAKMKRRARRAARKARKKRMQANRKRKISMRRRPHSSKPHKSKKK
jgi:hypothetical protein